MKNKLCLSLALFLAMGSVACQRVNARIQIREANDLYTQEKYNEALDRYVKARKIDPSFDDLDRMIGYSYLGLYRPDDKSPSNEKIADQAIEELKRYLKKQPDDEVAREALINLFLNANRNAQAIGFFKEQLVRKPNDLNAVRSIATLYAKQGDFLEAMNWYKKITLLDGKNPEAFYTYGVVLYEKVAKNPDVDPVKNTLFIEDGKNALKRAIDLKPDYFEADV